MSKGGPGRPGPPFAPGCQRGRGQRWLAGGTVAGVYWAFSTLLWAAELGHPQGFNDFVWAVLNARGDLNSGGLVHMYAGNGSLLVALPGFNLLLATVIRVTTLVGISPPVLGLASAHGGRISANFLVGGAWNVVYPFALALGLSAIFPLDAFARRCGISGARRYILLGGSAWARG